MGCFMQSEGKLTTRPAATKVRKDIATTLLERKRITQTRFDELMQLNAPSMEEQKVKCQLI